jgi:hypothetical protein
VDLVTLEDGREVAGHVVASSLWPGIFLILSVRTSAIMANCGASMIEVWSPGTE